MAIWGFFGTLGSGKDLLANYFFKIKLQKYNPKKIVTHVELKLPHTYMPLDDIFSNAINNTDLFKRTILYMSEFHLIMDARRSSASVNVDFSQQILIQLGKLDCDLFYSCQTIDQMDKRIKENQKYYFFCHKNFRLDENELSKTIEFNGETKRIFDLIDWDDRIVINPITKEPVPFDITFDYVEFDGENTETSSGNILPWEIIQTIFNNYNTREIIKFDRKKYLK